MFSNIPDRAQIAQGTTAAPVETAAERVVRLRDEGMAQQAAERERHIQENPLAAFTPRVYSDATINFVNPYFTNSGPREDRFDYTQTGSGVTGTENPALWFDQLFGSPYASIADTPTGANLTDKVRLGPNLGGRSGGRHYVELMWGEQAAANAAHNAAVMAQRWALNNRMTQSRFTDALAAAGISPSDYASMDAINALDPRKKLQFLDMFTRMQEEKNQRPNFGFSDALGIGLTAASMFAPGPWSAAALGASGAAAGGGDLRDIALSAGLAGLGNWAGDKFSTWATNTFPNAAAATGIKSLGTAAGWGGLGLQVAGQLIQPTISAVGHSLLAESPSTPPNDSSSDSQGGILSGGTDSMTQGVGSLPQTTSSYVDPTPYLGVAHLNPAFMNQFELGNAASPSGVASLDPAFMNQLERAELGMP
jgi:hypothetical protein